MQNHSQNIREIDINETIEHVSRCSNEMNGVLVSRSLSAVAEGTRIDPSRLIEMQKLMSWL
jgi:hypothetical protein